jgi:hypothetical protein
MMTAIKEEEKAKEGKQQQQQQQQQREVKVEVKAREATPAAGVEAAAEPRREKEDTVPKTQKISIQKKRASQGTPVGLARRASTQGQGGSPAVLPAKRTTVERRLDQYVTDSGAVRDKEGVLQVVLLFKETRILKDGLSSSDRDGAQTEVRPPHASSNPGGSGCAEIGNAKKRPSTPSDSRLYSLPRTEGRLPPSQTPLLTHTHTHDGNVHPGGLRYHTHTVRVQRSQINLLQRTLPEVHHSAQDTTPAESRRDTRKGFSCEDFSCVRLSVRLDMTLLHLTVAHHERCSPSWTLLFAPNNRF